MDEEAAHAAESFPEKPRGSRTVAFFAALRLISGATTNAGERGSTKGPAEARSLRRWPKCFAWRNLPCP